MNRIPGLAVPLSFLALVGTLHAQAFEQQELLPSLAAQSTYFGCAVSIDGDTLAVGGRYDSTDPAAPAHGAVEVFRRDPATHQWSFAQKLLASDYEIAAQFGASVAVAGDLIAVGSHAKDRTGAADAGAVYLFRWNAALGSWQEEQKVEASVATGSEYFGFSVDVEGDVLLVGAIQSLDAQVVQTGSAYVFRYDATAHQWNQEAQLFDSDREIFGNSGWSVALDGTTAAIGSPNTTEGGQLIAGSVDLWSVNGTTWTEGEELQAPVPGDHARFGRAIDLRGSQLIVGAPLETVATTAGVGAAYLFQRSAGTFALQQRLDAPTSATNEQFGVSVGVNGNLVAIGAVGDLGAGLASGAGFLFRRGGVHRSWVFDQKLGSRGAYLFDELGSSVAMGEFEVAIGGQFCATSMGIDSGAVEIYAAVELTLTIEPQHPAPGATIDLTAFRGEPGDLVLIVVHDIDGTPFFTPLISATFGSDHAFAIQGAAPSPALGVSVGLRAWKVSPTGRLAVSELAFVDV